MPRQRHHNLPYIPQSRKGPSPNSRRLTPCGALHEDGSECTHILQQPQYDFCSEHHFEKKSLNAKYKQTQADYEARRVLASNLGSGDLEEIVRLGDKVVALRDEVNRRFFSKGTENNRGHIQQILKIKNEVDRLRILVASQQHTSTNFAADEEPASTSAGGGTDGQTRVYQSLLSPDVPLSKLNHLPRDPPVLTLREFIDTMRDSQVDKIYKIFPSLNDSTDLIHDAEEGTERAPDKGDIVIQYVFREFLVWTGDTEVLVTASRTETIDTFLRHSTTELDNYIKFLEVFKSGRHDTAHFLRDAICDYLLPQDAPCMTILGGRVASEPHQRRMGIDGWDILYQYFSHKDTWRYLEQYSVMYDDLLLVKKLSTLHRYDSGDEGPSWLHPDDDVSQECGMALLLGFVAQTKGFCDPKEPFTHGVDGSVTEQQTRNYVAGRMSKNDSLAQKLIQELPSRVVRFIVFVYDQETGTYVVDTGDMDQNWVSRTRTACNQKQLVDAPWKVEWSVKDILDDLELIRSIRDRMMGRDYYEFIIIDRKDRPKFDVLEYVADALMQLSGNLTGQGVIVKTVRDIIPSAEQDRILEATIGEPPLPTWRLSTSVPHVEYEGNRLRAWDVQRNYPCIVEGQKDRHVWDIQENNILSGILASMEEHGVISRAVKFERPHATVKLLMAVDGRHDLYWDYSSISGGAIELDTRLGELELDNTTSKLLCNATLSLDGDGLRHFVEAFKDENPAAVFTKGMIHTHYCAWPFPRMRDIHVLADLNFCTPDGHLYRWKSLPFDFPLSFEAWQYLLHCEINCKLPFVRATQTTFVICASTAAEAETNVDRLLVVAEKMGWRLSFPMTHRWTSELDMLDAEVLWKGIQPLAARL